MIANRRHIRLNRTTCWISTRFASRCDRNAYAFANRRLPDKVRLGHAWDQFVLPWYATSGVLSLGNFGPVLAGNHIVCIHDANAFIEPESFSRAFGLAYRTLLPLIGKRASRVATVSQFSADMLVKFGVCRREKIFIAPNGHEHALRWDASRAAIPRLKVLKRPYVLLLGSSSKTRTSMSSWSKHRDLTRRASTSSLSARHRAFFLRMRPAISDPTFITPAMLAMTTWPRPMRGRYVWHFHRRPRGSEFRRWRQWPGVVPSSLRTQQV